ncbi:MAG: hypothetical protein H0U88_06825, partial [Chthoniobacterales bacterium]|nr:hypothetical protein [Chthoniobacterales bacterium]
MMTTTESALDQEDAAVPPVPDFILQSGRGRFARRILLAVAAFSLLGIVFALWLRGVPAGQRDTRNFFNVFYVLFAQHEPLGLGVVALFSVASGWLCFGRNSRPHWQKLTSSISERRAMVWIAVAVFLIAAAGTHLVCHNYALTADENLADFQAKIFLHGKMQAEVPQQWRHVEGMLRPTFVDHASANHMWRSSYLPVYAAMRTVFQSVQLQSLLNPFLAAVSIIALYGTARNLWPERKGNALVAVALLATSSQFLVMSMTSYAMPAHLALNTIWLWLYCRPDRRSFYLAPFLGVLAIGLHQPIVHA